MSIIGARNRLLAFERRTGAVDGANVPLPDAWELHKKKWAELRGETGMSTIRAAASADGVNTPLNRYSARVNFDRSITEDMRVVDNFGTIYEILAVRHDLSEREWTDVVIETGGTNG